MKGGLSVVAGAVLLVGAVGWRHGPADRWLQRVPPGWGSSMSYIGTFTYPDSTASFPGRDAIALYEREVRVVSDTGRPRSVITEDHFRIRNPETGGVTWEYGTLAVVDPATGARLEPEYLGEYFTFPARVEQRTYRLRANYLKGIPLGYQGTDALSGLETYVFGYRGPAEYTESYAGSGDFRGLALAPGQEIRCADDQFLYRAWVEPVTGTVIKVEERCTSGDYVYERATGTRLEPVARWSGVTSGSVVADRVELARRRRLLHLWVGRYLPLGLGLAGLLLLGAGLRRARAGGSA